MKVRIFAVVLASTLLLSGCGSDIMHRIVKGGMEHWNMMHSDHMGHSMHHSMDMGSDMSMDHDQMMGMMDQMMSQMQGMIDGSMPADMDAMKSMMGEMDSMMQGMGQMHGMMMSGSMKMESQGHMDEMMGKMDSMMQMMEKMHGKMMDGSMKMDTGQMEEMQSRMDKMKEMMQMMHGGMMGGSMNMTDTMPMDDSMSMSGTMPMTETMTMTDSTHAMHHGGMTMDASKPFDAQFIDSMIVHHQGAIAMANELLKKTDRPELKTFAESIISAQTKEIADMQSWRKSWYPDLADTGGMDMAMGDMKLSSDESKPYDQRFLEAMISHHQGAVDMATMAQHMAEHSEIKTLADAIITAQNAEIDQMKSWLKEWFGAQ
ncbi:MAG: DUF305 domain-containing protein [Caldilineaceae bacterium]